MKARAVSLGAQMTPRSISLLAATAIGLLAWGLLWGGDALFGPHAHPAGAGGLLASVTLWFVMMVAMMLPALAPWLGLFGSMAPDAYPGRNRSVVVGQFAAGYFAVWLLYAVAAALLQGGLQRAASLDVDLRVGATLGGLLLIGAGLFQLTPAKEACLNHCRSPLGFFLSRWDGGPRGPFKMGTRHGIWCVGCCWALMLLSFVLGAMNLLWMAALTLMIVAEQNSPRRLRLDRVFGVALSVWGLALIVT